MYCGMVRLRFWSRHTPALNLSVVYCVYQSLKDRETCSYQVPHYQHFLFGRLSRDADVFVQKFLVVNRAHRRGKVDC